MAGGSQRFVLYACVTKADHARLKALARTEHGGMSAWLREIVNDSLEARGEALLEELQSNDSRSDA